MFDKIQYYLESIPVPYVLAGIVAVGAFFIFVPSKFRLSLSLALMMVWLILGQMLELGLIHRIAKATGFAVYALVAIAAMMDPGPRRKLPAMALVYVPTAILSFLYILTVHDFALALAFRIQWLLIVIAALFVARTIVDEASLKRVIYALVMGLVIALAIPFSELVLNPAIAIKGLGRFTPYDSNPNQIGVLFALAAPLTLYFAMQTKNMLLKGVLLFSCAAAIGMGLLTASRSTMLVIIVCIIPIAIALTRRPLFIIVSIGTIGLMLFWFFGSVNSVDLERMGRLETGRVQIAINYLNIISEQPLFGLLETQGESFLRSSAFGGNHAHNAYLETLYFGGITYAIPVFALVLYSLSCSFKLWRKTSILQIEPLFLNVLLAMMVMIYAHGFINNSLYYPTTTMAFIHILLSIVVMSIVSDIRLGVGFLADETYEQEYEWVDDNDDISDTYLADPGILRS